MELKKHPQLVQHLYTTDTLKVTAEVAFWSAASRPPDWAGR